MAVFESGDRAALRKARKPNLVPENGNFFVHCKFTVPIFRLFFKSLVFACAVDSGQFLPFYKSDISTKTSLLARRCRKCALPFNFSALS